VEYVATEPGSVLPVPDRVRELLHAGGCPWPAPRVRETVGSTNADVVEMAAQGAPDGTCEVAGEQTAGRGRHGRSWDSPLGAGLWSSTLITDCEEPARLPLLAALAVRDAASSQQGPTLSIKWPNDVLAPGDRKIAGILAERCDRGVVVGIGINLTQSAGELPTETATSWQQEVGSIPDRSELLADLLLALHRWIHEDWGVALTQYRAASVTLGKRIRVFEPGGRQWDGDAVDIDRQGHLVVREGENLRTVIAGDVMHATIAP